jgi:hypothetical protein
MKQHLKILTDIVLNPAKYYWVANTPGQFDAAEYLCQNHYQELSKKVADKVDQILLRSGKYVTAS